MVQNLVVTQKRGTLPEAERGTAREEDTLRERGPAVTGSPRDFDKLQPDFSTRGRVSVCEQTKHHLKYWL